MIHLFSSCTGNAVSDEFKPIPYQLWNYNFTPSFDVNIKDKEIPYKLKVNLRLTAEYRYSNIFLLVHQINPGEKKTAKRIELKVADKDGRWLGKGLGNLYTYQVSYHSNYHFPDTGRYQFIIEQNMRDSPLKGVSDVGICVVPESNSK